MSSSGGLVKSNIGKDKPEKIIDWAKINASLPAGNSDEEKARRKKMFRDFDANGNGLLSLAEIDKAVRVVLKIDELFDAKPAIMRAYQLAKDSGRSKHGDVGDDYIELCEFKFFLIALRQYFEYWVAFTTVDSDNDHRITLEEFKACQPKIETWVGKIEDIEATFAEIDDNGGGQILFDEFCTWAITKSLDLEDDEELECDDFHELIANKPPSKRK